MDERGVGVVDPALVARRVRASYDAELGEVRAFLPARVPLDELPSVFSPYLAACAELPERYPAESGGVRDWLAQEFRRHAPAVQRAIPGLSEAERDRLMTVLSVLGHTYRWNCAPPAPARFKEQRISLPAGIAGPWTSLARRCGHPRVGTTWSLHLCNWGMNDRPGGAAYRTDELTGDNLHAAHNWLLPPFDGDLGRFSLSFVLLEARGAEVLRHLVDTVDAAGNRQVDAAMLSLEHLHGAINAMTLSLSRNVRKRTVDPTIWLELIQPTFVWSAATDVPGRVEGGPSGMQVGTVQALDAVLGVGGSSALPGMARKGRRYMPVPHRRLLETLDLAGPVLRDFVRRTGSEDLTEQFNRCVRDLASFRATHHGRAAQYLENRPAGDAPRASTGLVIGVDDEPMAIFERTMAERAAETHAAIITPSVHPDGRPAPPVTGHAEAAPEREEPGCPPTGPQSWRS